MAKVRIRGDGPDGMELHYEEVGADQGDPIIFLSGLGGDHRAFSMALRQFGQNHHAIAMDNRDAGLSDRARAPYALSDMADDVRLFMDKLGLESARFVGQSMGALIAQHLAVAAPDRVTSLVLASTHAGMTPWRIALVESWIEIRKLVDAPTFTRLTLPWLVAPRFYLDQAHVDGMVRFVARSDPQQDAAAFERQARAILGHHGDGLPKISGIQCPTLVLVGELDIINPPPIARELASALPNAQMTIIPHVGHIPHVEDGQSFRNAIANFYRELTQ